ncbi:MAG: prolyl oligopeptidase family serine peptidase [Planctomycetaceae bacterium]|nr:prolyl oligopeptidase family serine peptidase [Planctomycetaceae bacterium]
MRRCITGLFLASLILTRSTLKTEAQEPHSTIPPRKTFELAGRRAFVILPPAEKQKDGPLPWVWYAPTLGKNLPGRQEAWMFTRFLDRGIAIAGIDVGESYGSPEGRAGYQTLYEELTKHRGFGPKPVLLARSRGGLMLYNWAVEHPESVGGIAGIYPVCNLTSYPGLKRAASAYEMTADELQEQLTAHNPIDRLAPLAKNKVSIYHLHGDMDKVVPLAQNSGELAARYKALGGPIELEVIAGQGHNLWQGWFQSVALTQFVIEEALSE